MADAVRAAGAEQAAYVRWRTRVLRSNEAKATTLSPAGLEAAIMSLAARNPEYVVFEEVR
jgi:hypothetical protein